jgi:4-aminobutyrate aminotransferase/(S)-3-amino-2-methylpropionate transaminase
VLQVIEEEGLMQRAEQIGKTLKARWEEVAQDVPQIGDVRGVGAMVGVEFVRDRETKQPHESFVGALVGQAMKNGVVAVSCGPYHNVLRHLMPLVITDEELDEGLDVLADAAVKASKGQSDGVPPGSLDVEGE